MYYEKKFDINSISNYTSNLYDQIRTNIKYYMYIYICYNYYF